MKKSIFITLLALVGVTGALAHTNHTVVGKTLKNSQVYTKV